MNPTIECPPTKPGKDTEKTLLSFNRAQFSALSLPLESMLFGPFQESNQTHLSIQEVKSIDAWKLLKVYLDYKEELNLLHLPHSVKLTVQDVHLIVELWRLADHFLIQEVVDRCVKGLEECLQDYRRIELAEYLLNSPFIPEELLLKARRIILLHFPVVWKQFSIEELVEIFEGFV